MKIDLTKGLNEEQRQVQLWARKFARAEFTDEIIKAHENYAELNEKTGLLKSRGKFPHILLPKFAQLGFLNAVKTMDTVSNNVMMVEFSRVRADFALALFAVPNTLTYFAIAEFGTNKQKQEYLPRMEKGELLAAFCLTEADIGSDAANIKLRATKDGDYYVFSSTNKNLITSAGEAGVLIVFARTGDAEKDGPHKTISAFLVDKQEGIECGKIEKVCLFASPIYSISLDGIRVHKSQMLGKEGKGLPIALHILNCGRPIIGAQGLGVAIAAYEDAYMYVRDRIQFAKPLIEIPEVAKKLERMKLGIEASWAVLLRAAKAKDEGHPQFPGYASLAKLVCTEVAAQVAWTAACLHGGYGIAAEYRVSRYPMEALTFTRYEGVSEIQRKNILRVFGKEKVLKAICGGLTDRAHQRIVRRIYFDTYKI